MPIKLTYSVPQFPKGTEVAINGLGLLKNQEAVEFSDEEIALFEATVGMKIREALKDNDNIKIEAAKGGDS